MHISIFKTHIHNIENVSQLSLVYNCVPIPCPLTSHRERGSRFYKPYLEPFHLSLRRKQVAYKLGINESLNSMKTHIIHQFNVIYIILKHFIGIL